MLLFGDFETERSCCFVCLAALLIEILDLSLAQPSKHPELDFLLIDAPILGGPSGQHRQWHNPNNLLEPTQQEPDNRIGMYIAIPGEILPEVTQSLNNPHDIIAEGVRLSKSAHKLLDIVVHLRRIEHRIEGEQVFLQIEVEVGLQVGVSDGVVESDLLEVLTRVFLYEDVGVEVPDYTGDLLVDYWGEVGIGAWGEVEHAVEGCADVAFQEPALS